MYQKINLFNKVLFKFNNKKKTKQKSKIFIKITHNTQRNNNKVLALAIYNK